MFLQPKVRIEANNETASITARYGEGIEIIVTSAVQEKLVCTDAPRAWRKIAFEAYQSEVLLPPNDSRQEQECRVLQIRFVGFSAQSIQATSVDLWLMQDYFLGSNGQHVAQPVEQFERFLPGDFE
jgi:hypothetical protein